MRTAFALITLLSAWPAAADQLIATENPMAVVMCKAIANDAAAMARRRELGFGPQPGTLESVRANVPKLYSTYEQMTHDIFSHQISPRTAWGWSWQTCGWRKLPD